MNQSTMWLIWALSLTIQNWTFTFVSRARNSGSLKRHILAAIGSNGVWILQLQLMLGPMFDYLNGKHGIPLQIGAALFYTAFTVLGSVLAHKWALKNEKGKGAVGASARYAQITTEEWEQWKRTATLHTQEPTLDIKPISNEVCVRTALGRNWRNIGHVTDLNVNHNKG